MKIPTSSTLKSITFCCVVDNSCLVLTNASLLSVQQYKQENLFLFVWISRKLQAILYLSVALPNSSWSPEVALFLIIWRLEKENASQIIHHFCWIIELPCRHFVAEWVDWWTWKGKQSEKRACRRVIDHWQHSAKPKWWQSTCMRPKLTIKTCDNLSIRCVNF